MASTKPAEEVQILHFFEKAPIEKAEAVFNIICEKMRERAPGRAAIKQRPAKPKLTLPKAGESAKDGFGDPVATDESKSS